MQRAKVGSWAPVALGLMLSAGLLAACGGGSSGSTSITPSANAANSSSTSTASTSTTSPSPTQAAQTSAVTLAWQPPTENTDGTALTDLSGYAIRYGTQSQNYTQTIQVTNPGLTNYVVDNLAPGTYYFAISATASDGSESDPSPEVTATVN